MGTVTGHGVVGLHVTFHTNIEVSPHTNLGRFGFIMILNPCRVEVPITDQLRDSPPHLEKYKALQIFSSCRKIEIRWTAIFSVILFLSLKLP